MKRWTAAVALCLCAISARADEVHVVTPGPKGGALDPAAFAALFESSANAFRTKYPGSEAFRFVKLDIAYPHEGAEYEAFGHQAIVLLGAVTHDQSEFPLARVYVRRGGQDVALKQLFSVQRPFAAGSAAAEVYGPVREDSVYLIPAALIADGAQLLCDFTAHRTGFVVSALPADPPPHVRAQTAPGPDPSPDALRTFMQREYPGFMPESPP